MHFVCQILIPSALVFVLTLVLAIVMMYALLKCTNNNIIILAVTYFSFSVFPQVEPYNFTELDAFDDQELGALIVKPNDTILMFSVDVVADPCPDITWSFNGSRIGPSNVTFTYNNACIQAGTGNHNNNWTFTLKFLLTAATSGNYSASFTNVAGMTLLPRTYLTVPGMCISKLSYSKFNLMIVPSYRACLNHWLVFE